MNVIVPSGSVVGRGGGCRRGRSAMAPEGLCHDCRRVWADDGDEGNVYLVNTDCGPKDHVRQIRLESIESVWF